MTRMLVLAAALLAIAQHTAAQSTPQTTAPPAQPTGTATPSAATPAATPATAPQPATAPAQAAPPSPPAQAAPAVPPAQPAPAVAVPPAPPPQPQTAAPAQPAPRGRRLYTWGSVGTTFANGETYASANLGVGYLMRRGITPNVEATYAFGNSPTMWALRPGVTWFMPIPRLNPYVGAYYTHWFVGDNATDEDGVGARLGISLGRLISIGATYERLLDCSRDCDVWSPQVSAGFSM